MSALRALVGAMLVVSGLSLVGCTPPEPPMVHPSAPGIINPITVPVKIKYGPTSGVINLRVKAEIEDHSLLNNKSGVVSMDFKYRADQVDDKLAVTMWFGKINPNVVAWPEGKNVRILIDDSGKVIDLYSDLIPEGKRDELSNKIEGLKKLAAQFMPEYANGPVRQGDVAYVAPSPDLPGLVSELRLVGTQEMRGHTAYILRPNLIAPPQSPYDFEADGYCAVDADTGIAWVCDMVIRARAKQGRNWARIHMLSEVQR
jgi:hypothetical protein